MLKFLTSFIRFLRKSTPPAPNPEGADTCICSECGRVITFTLANQYARPSAVGCMTFAWWCQWCGRLHRNKLNGFVPVFTTTGKKVFLINRKEVNK